MRKWSDLPDTTEPVQEVALTIRPLARGREDVMPSVYTESEASDENTGSKTVLWVDLRLRR